MYKPDAIGGQSLAPHPLGIFDGVSNADYHADPAVSKSGLDRIAQSPAHYRAYLAEGNKETPALQFGRITHRYILEAVPLAVVPESINRRTKDGKAEHEAFLRENAGREIVTAEEHETLQAMRESVYTHQAAAALLTNAPGGPEVSAWWLDAHTGEPCRCRPDWLRADGVIIDLKTTEDASPGGFSRSVAKYRYHVQAAFYLDGIRAITGQEHQFAFLAAEKTPPYAVGVYVLDYEAVEVGRIAYLRNLETLADCKIRNHWPAYSPKVETLTLPAWALKGE